MAARSGPRAGLSRPAFVAALLCVLAALAYGGHIAHGGRYSDDWQVALDFAQADSPRYPEAVGHEARAMGARPLLAVLKPLPAAVFGDAAGPALAAILVLGVLVVLAFWALLRRLRLDAGPATAVSTSWGCS